MPLQGYLQFLAIELMVQMSDYSRDSLSNSLISSRMFPNAFTDAVKYDDWKLGCRSQDLALPLTKNEARRVRFPLLKYHQLF
jgi:hypothetical protein